MKNAFQKPTQVQAPCLLDFYKCFHAAAYKDGVTEVLINFTARFGKHTNIPNGETYFWAGAQGFINTIIVDVWNEFFAASKEDAVATYKRVNEHGLGKPCDTSRLEALHDLGYMPLEFRALKEGSEVPYGVSAMTVRNTHPDFFFLPNMVETILSDEIWPVQTSLTTAVAYMRTLKEFASIDGTPDFLIPFMCHDFSMRGMMGGTINGGAALSGLGHLMSGFAGSDTLPAALKAEKDYGASLDAATPCVTIASVDATEHSVQCSFNNDDLGYFRHCMKTASPTGILSLVSDGYDFWELVTGILPQLKDEIMARDGKIVIRPDSGDPADVICGYDYINVGIKDSPNIQDAMLRFGDNLDGALIRFGKRYYRRIDLGTYYYDYFTDGIHDWHNGDYVPVILPKKSKMVYFVRDEDFEFDSGHYDERHYYKIEEVPKCEVDGLIEVLWDIFGGTEVGEVGGKVYKHLDEHIGAIYGDSITLERQRDIYERLHYKGFAVANIVLGVGSYTYQYVTRDTHGSAVKATNMIIDGVDTPIAKEVKTDALKKSAKGRLKVVLEDGVFVQHDQQTIQQVLADDNEHELVWSNGKWYRTQTLEQVRNVVATFI